MTNTRNSKDIAKLNVYEIVWKLKGVRKKYRHINMLHHITLQSIPESSIPVITALGSL